MRYSFVRDLGCDYSADSSLRSFIMKKILSKTTPVILVCIFLLAQTSLLWAADDITGLWEVRMDFNGRQTFADLSISKNLDGSYGGKWGQDELSGVNFQDGKLTFTRTVVSSHQISKRP